MKEAEVKGEHAIKEVVDTYIFLYILTASFVHCLTSLPCISLSEPVNASQLSALKVFGDVLLPCHLLPLLAVILPMLFIHEVSADGGANGFTPAFAGPCLGAGPAGSTQRQRQGVQSACQLNVPFGCLALGGQGSFESLLRI
jgi:hypothetical protein